MGLIPYVKDLDAPLLRISRRGDFFTTRHGCGGVQFLGVQGAGKTTSAQMLAGGFLRAGFGAYVTAAKPEVIPQWLAYGQKHGCARSIVLMDENEGFNILDYEMARHGMAGIGTVVEYIMRVIEASRRASGTASQRGGEVFWEDASRVVQRYALPPLYAANGALSFPDIIRFISTAPASAQQVASREWQESSFMFRTLKLAAERPRVRMSEAALRNVVTFWREQWPSIPDKTRGNIAITVTAALDRFNHGRLNRFFCGKTTVVPEMSFHGAVLVDAKQTNSPAA